MPLSDGAPAQQLAYAAADGGLSRHLLRRDTLAAASAIYKGE